MLAETAGLATSWSGDQPMFYGTVWGGVMGGNTIVYTCVYPDGGYLPQWARSMIGTTLRERSVSSLSSLLFVFIILCE